MLTPKEYLKRCTSAALSSADVLSMEMLTQVTVGPYQFSITRGSQPQRHYVWVQNVTIEQGELQLLSVVNTFDAALHDVRFRSTWAEVYTS